MNWDKFLQVSVDVSDLIEESYRRFGNLDNQHIDRLRLKFRLRVVQTIEDHTMKNIIRSVAEKSVIKGKELQELYMLFKVRYFFIYPFPTYNKSAADDFGKSDLNMKNPYKRGYIY